MYSNTEVSSAFSKQISGYIRAKYKLNDGLMQTSKKVYTLMDRMSFANAEFILNEKTLMRKRIENFNYYLTVKSLNDKETFQQFLEQFKDIKTGLVFITGKELELIKKTFNCSELDSVIDCVMLTAVFTENFYHIIADFITSIFDNEEELWEE